MCICLNCKYINICKQYFLIEKTHNEPNINETPKFLPLQSITIMVADLTVVVALLTARVLLVI